MSRVSAFISFVRCASTIRSPDLSTDLVLEYLEEENHGIVVVGLNRSKVMKAIYKKNLVASLTEALDAVQFDKKQASAHIEGSC